MAGLDIDTLNTELKVKTCIFTCRYSSNMGRLIEVYFRSWCHWPSSHVAIPVIAWATSLNRTTVARAIAAAIATALRSVAAAIANKYVMRNIDQSTGEKAFRISPTSFNITFLIGWFYPGRIPNNGTAVRHQL